MEEAAYLRLLRAPPARWGDACGPLTRAHEWVELLHRCGGARVRECVCVCVCMCLHVGVHASG
jgi:hypothetical protein